MKKILPIVLIGILLAGLLIIPRIQNKQTPKPIEMPSLIQVEIRGAVHMPGVYEVVLGTTLESLIQYAMGPNMTADLSQLNLTTPLVDGVKYIIPSKSETSTSDKVNINQASLEMLMTIPGIGKVTAQKIIDYRVKEGPFMRVEDIQMVSGIGAQTFENIKAFITI